MKKRRKGKYKFNTVPTAEKAVKDKTAVERVSMQVIIRDTEHFNRMIKYLNTHVGVGSKNWKMCLPVRKHLHDTKNLKRSIGIRKDIGDDIESLKMMLALL